VDRNLSVPYDYHWFAGVQRRLPGNWLVEANYLGQAGRKLLIRNNINRYKGDRADGVVNRINQSFSTIVHGYNAASSIYNGLAAQVTRRFSSGFAVQAAYTFSRSIDTNSEPFGGGAGQIQNMMDVTNLRLDRGRSAFDANHRFAANFLYELPFLRSGSGVVSSLLGGWQVNGIVSLQSGFPFTAITADDYNLDGDFTDRPSSAQATPRIPGDGPSQFANGVFGPQQAWTSLFVPAAPGANGNLGRNTFSGPGYATCDFSLMKDFATPWFTAERSRWEFRAEFFNIFNRVNLRPPSNSLGTFNATTRLWSNFNFGRSLSSFDARQIQFGLKFRF
jgi:hypothetical protein